jgi:OOP family OmpA-OmpF porin
MSISWKTVAGAMALVAQGALAQDAPPNYVSGMGSYIIEDSARAGDKGIGWHVIYGSPVNRWLSVELNGFGTKLDRKGQSAKDYQYAFGVDLRGLGGSDWFGYYALGGLGSLYDDLPGSSEISPYVDLGGGVLIGTGWRPLKVRGEGRYYATFNGKSFPGKSVEYDAHLNLGLEFAFGEATERSAPIPAAIPNLAITADDDGDGVLNDRDECPGTPAGMMVDERGCPPAAPLATGNDDDGDGVVNSLDLCPNTPRGLKVDEHGCATQAQSIVILKNVHFEFDKSELTGDARRVLDGVADGMKGQMTMQVELSGHTDALGTQSYNLALSQRRADAVRTYLIERGVDPARMKAEGYGEFQPIAENETEAGRGQNRRVEFKVVKQ